MPTTWRNRGHLGGAITDRLAAQPPAWLAILGVSMFAALTVLRFKSTPGLNFAVLYLVPISFFTWFIGLRSGIATALASALALESFDITHGARAHFYWDTLMSLGMFIFMVFILSEVRGLYERERSLSRTDALTGVMNRRAFVEALHRESARNRRFPRPLTLAYLDVDDFKRINDTQGHAAGDALLLAVAQLMENSVRDVDSVGRLGGDEFAILMPETDADDSKVAIRKVETKLKESAVRQWPVTFSIGVVTFEKVPDSADEMVRMADELMYSVKQSGKNRSEFQRFPRAA